MRIISLLLLVGWLGLAPPGIGAATADGGPLEDLQYRLSLGVWQDVGRAHLRLSQVGPNRYRAEFTGAPQGAWKLLSRWLPERYETEMTLEDGRLRPLVYREVFRYQGRRICKDYRFDYAEGLIEVWRSVDGQPMVKSGQTPLKEQVYDPLSLFYNLRLGALGILAPGQTLRVPLLPTPEPQEMVIHFGPETSQGRKVMLEIKGKGAAAETVPYFIFCTPQWVPQQAWARVRAFGKLSGHLLNPGEVMQQGLPALPKLSFNPNLPHSRN